MRFTLVPGQSYTLPAGSTIAFHDWKRWVSLQVSSTPGLWLVFASVLVAVTGLCLSLFIRPRRLWVRAGAGGVEVAGLDRTEGRGGLQDEVRSLAEALELAVTDEPVDEGVAQSPSGGAGSPQEDEED